MRVTISSSQNDSIDEKYKESSRRVCDYLAKTGWDLNWGSCPRSIMGICYDVFSKNNKDIKGYTSPKYVDQLVDLPLATHTTYDTTFDLKKHIFNDADLIVILPGGTGSISEFFAYLEEIRSNDVNTPLIVYNEDGHFDSTLALINDLVNRNFNSASIFDYFYAPKSFEEFVNLIEEIKHNKIVK